MSTTPFNDLQRIYITSFGDKEAALRDALNQGNLTELKTLTHRLAGSGGGYGFPEISSLARQVENRVIKALEDQQTDWSGIGEGVGALIELMSGIRSAL